MKIKTKAINIGMDLSKEEKEEGQGGGTDVYFPDPIVLYKL